MIEHQWAAVKGIAPPYLEEQCIGASKLSVAEGDGNFVNLTVQGGLLHGFVSTALEEHRLDFPPSSGTHGGEEGPPTYWINENVHGMNNCVVLPLNCAPLGQLIHLADSVTLFLIKASMGHRTAASK